MEMEVEVDITRAIGNLTFASTETDAVFFLLAHLPGFKKDEIEVEIDETKMEITVSGRGRMESVESVTVDRLVNISREVEIERFCEVFSLRDGIIFERVDATFDEEEGILVVLIPKLQREEASTRAVMEQIKEEEDEVSSNGDEDKFINEQPEPTPLTLESIEPHDRAENLKPAKEFSSNESEDEKYAYPDPKTPVDAQEIERIDEQSDQNCKDEDGNHDGEIEDPLLGTPGAMRLPEKDTDFNPVEEREMQESEESDDNLKDPPLEAPDEIRLPEIIDASFSFIEEQEEQEPAINRNPESKESESNREDENPPVRNEDSEPVKLPANDRSFAFIEEQEPELNQNPKSEESNPKSTQEYEDATIEAEDAPPKPPASIKLPEVDMQESETTQNPISEESSQNLKQTDQIPTADTEEPIKMPEMGTNFNSIQEQEERELETHQNAESKEPDQNFNREGEDSDEGSEDMGTTRTVRERGRRRVGKRSPGFPLNATSLLAGSAFLFSLVVLVFHFLREKKRSKN